MRYPCILVGVGGVLYSKSCCPYTVVWLEGLTLKTGWPSSGPLIAATWGYHDIFWATAPRFQIFGGVHRTARSLIFHRTSNEHKFPCVWKCAHLLNFCSLGKFARVSKKGARFKVGWDGWAVSRWLKQNRTLFELALGCSKLRRFAQNCTRWLHSFCTGGCTTNDQELVPPTIETGISARLAKLRTFWQIARVLSICVRLTLLVQFLGNEHLFVHAWSSRHVCVPRFPSTLQNSMPQCVACLARSSGPLWDRMSSLVPLSKQL